MLQQQYYYYKILLNGKESITRVRPYHKNKNSASFLVCKIYVCSKEGTWKDTVSVRTSPQIANWEQTYPALLNSQTPISRGGCGGFFQLQFWSSWVSAKKLAFLIIVSSVLPVEDRFPWQYNKSDFSFYPIPSAELVVWPHSQKTQWVMWPDSQKKPGSLCSLML